MSRAGPNFHPPESGHVSLFGTGSRTVAKLNKYDLSSLHKYRPDIVILEIGTSHLSILRTEVVGSQIDDLAHVLRDQYKIRVVGVCQVINRNTLKSRLVVILKATVLRQYLSVVLGNQSGIFLLEHKSFIALIAAFYAQTPCTVMQYHLYRSYRGIILTVI